MLLIDDLLAAPFNGILWIFKQVYKATTEELESRKQRSRSDLTELYMQLETGRISEAEFDEREKRLLDQLERIEALQKEAAPQPGGPG